MEACAEQDAAEACGIKLCGCPLGSRQRQKRRRRKQSEQQAWKGIDYAKKNGKTMGRGSGECYVASCNGRKKECDVVGRVAAGSGETRVSRGRACAA